MCHGNKKELASSSIHHHDVEGKNRKLEYLLWCNDHTFVIVNNFVSMVASISAQHKDKEPVRKTCVISNIYLFDAHGFATYTIKHEKNTVLICTYLISRCHVCYYNLVVHG
jgi:hypothetical protein